MSVSKGYSRHAALSGGVENDDEVSDNSRQDGSRSSFVIVAERIVMIVSGFVIGLLMVRMVLSILGANRESMFTDLIYTASHPFVTPFFHLFNYRLQYGESRFEVETLIAAAVYAIIAALIMTVLSAPSEPDLE